MFGPLAAFVLRHRRLVAVVVVVLSLAAAAGLSRMRIELSSKAFYGDGDSATATLDAFVARWGPDDATLVVLGVADDGVLTRERLDAVRALAVALRAQPDVVRVDAITDHPASAAIADGSSAARPALMSAPLVPLLLSADGRRTAIAVRLAFSSDDLPRTTQAVDSITALVLAHRGAPGLHWHVGGLPAVRAAFAAATLDDQRVLVPACLVVVVVVLGLAFRRAYQVVVPLVLALLPTAMTLGLMGWSGVPLGLLSQGYLLLLPVIAIADGIHLVSRTGDLAREAGPGASRESIIVEACRHTGLACLLTSTTTAIGFISLFASEMPMLRSFGLWAAIGVMLAYGVLLVLGPLLLARVRDLEPAARGGRLGDRLDHATAIGRRRPVVVLAVAAVVTTAVGWWARTVPVDNRLSDLLDADHPVTRVGAEIDAELGGVLSLELELRGAPGHFDAPWAIRALAELEDWAAAQAEVRVVLGPATALRAAGATPGNDTQAVRSGWWRLTAMGLRDDLLADDASAARVSIRVPDLGGLTFAEFATRVTARAEQLEGVEVVVTGTTSLAYEGVNRIAGALRRSLLGAIVVITIVMAVVFASMRIALVSLVPNIIPLVLGYAAIAWVQGRFDPLGGVVLAVALGIAVDDTIHLISRARQAHAEGEEPAAALATAVSKTGSACTITSVVLAAGLGLFALSSFPPLRLLGTLGATVIVLALICDLWILPAAMMLGWRPRPR